MPKTKELTSRQRQAIESKNRLVNAATDLFNERGYQDASVQDICAAAGLSVGVFYHYFASKQDALQAVLHQKTAELLHYIDTQSISKTHIEALLEVFQFTTKQQTEGPFELVCNALSPSVLGQVGRDVRLRDFLLNIVCSAQDTGELTDEIDAEVICEDLLISTRGYVFRWCEDGGSFDLITEMQAYLKRILRAYVGPEGKL